MSLYHRIALKKNDLTALETRKQFLNTREQKLEQEQEETRGQARESQARFETVWYAWEPHSLVGGV